MYVELEQPDFLSVENYKYIYTIKHGADIQKDEFRNFHKLILRLRTVTVVLERWQFHS